MDKSIMEDYVSFEVAQLLKEKGFDEPCYMSYWLRAKDSIELTHLEQNGNKYSDCICAPSLQMAMKWLREVHQLHISVDVSPLYGKVKDEKGRNVCGLLYWDYIASGEWMNEKFSPFQRAFVVSGESNEEAIEKALKFSLENLI